MRSETTSPELQRLAPAVSASLYTIDSLQRMTRSPHKREKHGLAETRLYSPCGWTWEVHPSNPLAAGDTRQEIHPTLYGSIFISFEEEDSIKVKPTESLVN